jgi:two-component system, sensor histidine kinase
MIPDPAPDLVPDLVRALLDPAEPADRQRDALLSIVAVLMRRVEQGSDTAGAAYAQFERAAMLEDQVRARTRDLERALDLLNDSNARLAQANRAAEAARQNLASAIETIREGFALFGPDDALVLCNARFCADLPDLRPLLRPDLPFAAYVEGVSRSPALVLPEGESPDDWQARRMARHREPHVIFNVQFAGDRWMQVSEHRTRDGGTVILQTDVTDIIRAEREERGKLLDDQARLVRATLDHISQGVCIFDAGGRMLGWNARAGELLALPLSDFRAGLPLADLLARLRGRVALSDGLTPQGLRAWALAAPPRPPLRFGLTRAGGGAVLDAFGQEMPGGGFVISFTDVSAERRAIAALRQANETLEARVDARTLELGDALARAERANSTRSRFVAAASHDLLQPLSAAKLFLASMADEDLPPRAAQALDKTTAALGSVETLLEALLDISRLESGRLTARVEPVPMGPLLARLAEEFAPLAEQRGLRLRVRPTLAVGLTDATWARRILQNLIANAIRYTATGGVVVGLRQTAAGLRIDVVDTGPGIPEDERENIFREFHRLNARASAAQGMGLGLAIVERAAAMLGHRVGLDSRLDRGSRFVLHLPAAPGPDAAPAPRATPARPRLPRDLIGLLIAPDADLRRALTHLLEGWGVGVLDLSDPAEALPLIDDIGLPPDFVLMDSRLGDEGAGLATLAAIAARHGPRPMSLLTASRDADLRARAGRVGVGLVYKPIDTRILERFVARVGGPA